jgi:hypothetical protein
MGTVQPLSKGKHGFHIHEVSVPLLILYGELNKKYCFNARKMA